MFVKSLRFPGIGLVRFPLSFSLLRMLLPLLFGAV
jgi:hypothetical protein